jgi:hypothetical protein
MDEADKQKQEKGKRNDAFSAFFALTMMLAVSLAAVCKLKDTYVEMHMQQGEISMTESWSRYLSFNAANANVSDRQTADKRNALRQEMEAQKLNLKDLKNTHMWLLASILSAFTTFLMLCITLPFQKRWMLIATAVPAALGLGAAVVGLLF